jgi:hypothetical protein
MDQAVIHSMTRRILVAPVVAVVAFGLSFIDVRLGTHAFFLIPLCSLRHRVVDSGWERPEESSA